MRGRGRHDHDNQYHSSYNDPLSSQTSPREKIQMKQPKQQRSRLPTDPNQVFAFQRLTYQVRSSSGSPRIFLFLCFVVHVDSTLDSKTWLSSGGFTTPNHIHGGLISTTDNQTTA